MPPHNHFISTHNNVTVEVFDFGGRLRKLQKLVASERLDAIVLSASEGFDANVFYYSGDETFPATLLVTPGYSAIYSLHAQDFAHSFDDCFPLNEARGGLRKKLKQLRVRVLGVDDYSASAGALLRLREKMRVELRPAGRRIAKQRLVKDAAEIRCIKTAGRISLRAAAGLSDFARNTEHQVAGQLEFRARRLGASLDAFPTMVLSGSRSAFFHNATSSKRIGRGELVLVDWGARFAHYCSDYTRTFYEGRDKKIRDAINAVLEAKKAAERKVRVNATGAAAAKAALGVINECGFEAHSFRKAGLSLGHFVGLDVHDTAERLEKTRLRPGMAFTIEPGVYVPGEFGVRFEDTLVLE